MCAIKKIPCDVTIDNSLSMLLTPFDSVAYLSNKFIGVLCLLISIKNVELYLILRRD